MEEKVTVNVNSQNIREIEQLTLVSLFLTIKRNLKIFIIGIALVFFISLFIFFTSTFNAYTPVDIVVEATPVVIANPIVKKHYMFMEPGKFFDKNLKQITMSPAGETTYKLQRIYLPQAILDLVSYEVYSKGNLEFEVESQDNQAIIGILFDEKLASPKNIDYLALMSGAADRLINDQLRVLEFLKRSDLDFISGRVIEAASIDLAVDEIEVVVEKNIETTNKGPAIHTTSPPGPSFIDFIKVVDKKLLLIPILGLIIGVLFGMVLVFVAEFLRKVKDVEDKL